MSTCSTSPTLARKSPCRFLSLSMTRSPAASASPISFSTLCKMHVFRKIGRLFKIKTRLEAWAVIYAITVGAVYRGTWYLHKYPGVSGWLLFQFGRASGRDRVMQFVRIFGLG